MPFQTQSIQEKPSNVFVPLLTVAFFTDPVITAKYFYLPPTFFLAVVLLGLCIFCIVLLKRRKWRLSKQLFSPFFLVLLYGATSIFYRVYVGQDADNLALQLLLVLNLFCILLLLNDRKYRGSLFIALVAAGVLHAMTMVHDPFGLRSNLLAATAYDYGAGGLAFFLRRETGLFPAPAMLVSYSLVLFIYAYVRLRTGGHIWVWAVIIGLALTLGVFTFNRSFPIALGFVLIMLLFTGGLSLRILIAFALGSLLIAVIIPWNQYVIFQDNRFLSILTDGIGETQRVYGNTGILTGLRVFIDNPLFGNPAAPGGGIFQVWNNGEQALPHNGPVLILAAYGIVGGIWLLSLYISSYVIAIRWVFWRALASRVSGSSHLKTYPRSLTLAYWSLGLALILMIEPLPEYSIVALLSFAVFFDKDTNEQSSW